ncbi:hypothetical protein C3432_20975 [Citrobacter amalonaticus]|uniref:Uncharacterized protein n=1 Tax=Citrobacter amalonaticus TaxID=35703 RepID=A0A2S4RUY9_CITAM|nr:hypothetical protein [Citrobacter amalonaticus]POT55529.1 hypothetical protein C3432_20975 [Citrobacter amalonaticus]POT73740.1 hypothetical protein C3436_18440 [Citrobacter amalonaticus]POU63965.1 hypothetical protein C3430_17375 [Citrobacter amalonaticus]POV03598.1 hypothetical protein C3424_20290 [Citrobacter amalonaticus]
MKEFKLKPLYFMMLAVISVPSTSLAADISADETRTILSDKKVADSTLTNGMTVQTGKAHSLTTEAGTFSSPITRKRT